MGKEITAFGNTAIEKRNFHHANNIILVRKSRLIRC